MEGATENRAAREILERMGEKANGWAKKRFSLISREWRSQFRNQIAAVHLTRSHCTTGRVSLPCRTCT